MVTITVWAIMASLNPGYSRMKLLMNELFIILKFIMIKLVSINAVVNILIAGSRSQPLIPS